MMLDTRIAGSVASVLVMRLGEVTRVGPSRKAYRVFARSTAALLKRPMAGRVIRVRTADCH